MKKILMVFLMFLIVLSVGTFAAESTIMVKVGGEILETDTPATIIQGRTMLPVRALFERLGATVEYDTVTKTVTAKNDERIVSLSIGSDIMYVDGEKRKIDVPATIVNNRTLIPLRACAEAFDLEVEWNGKTRTASVLIEDYYLVKHFWNDELYEEYDEKGNLLYTTVEEKGLEWQRFEYDENNNKVLFESNVGITKYKYDETGNLVYWENDSGYWGKYEYDDLGRETKYDSNAEWYNKSYDSNGNLIFEERGYHGDDKYNSWAKYIYDQNNNLIKIESNNGNVTEYTYDDMSRLTYESYSDNDSKNVKYTYDGYGNITRKEKKHYWEEFTYDIQGRLIHWIDSKDEQNIYEYDDKGNLIYKQVGDEVTSNDYDEDGNLIYTETIYTYSSFWFKFEYDENGNKIKQENDDGVITTYEYDANQNLIKQERSDGRWTKYVYDTNGKLVFSEDSFGLEQRYEYVLTKR